MAKIEQLKNNCRVSELVVTPANYMDKDANANIKWSIRYRFYDDNRGENMQVRVRSFNTVSTLKEKRTMVSEVLAQLRAGFAKGYNPFVKKGQPKTKAPKHPVADPNTPSPKMAFSAAMLHAWAKTNEGVKRVSKDYDSFTLRLNEKAVILNLATMSICDIDTGHLRSLLDACGIKEDSTFSDDKFNRYRGMLHLYYEFLVEARICTTNILRDLRPKRKGIHTMRDTLQHEHLADIDTYLAEAHPEFQNYTHCFHHSGGRSTELFRLRVRDVDFKNSRIKYLVLKGRRRMEVYGPIPTVAVKYWKKAVTNAPEDYYIFSDGLKPGPTQISAAQVTRYFKRWVKDRKNADGSPMFPDVTADFYTYKHRKVSDMIREVGLAKAAIYFKEDPNTLAKKYDHEGAASDFSSLINTGKELGK